ncbi:hypothetical protein OAG38_02925 [Akkermansiaceae bacterium]|nr:hypothetical protein [Akkermansiaceae bacterium]
MKKICLIDYPYYFIPLAESLISNGHEVYWITSKRSCLKKLSKIFKKNNILYLNASKSHASSNDIDTGLINEIENSSGLNLNNIILMDRILSIRKPEQSKIFLLNAVGKIEKFLSDENIQITLNWRDTAIQVATTMVSHHLNIKNIIPTRIRMPDGYYGFTTQIETDSFVKIETCALNEARRWATKFFQEFNKCKQIPGLKFSMKSGFDILKYLPNHLKAFRHLVIESLDDRGNELTRYKLAEILKKYIVRRKRFFEFKLNIKRIISDGKVFEKYSIFPLHTQPESSIDVQGAFYSNQVELIKSISRSLPTGHTLLVKIHPGDVDGQNFKTYKLIYNIPGVELVMDIKDKHKFIENADYVFTISGSMGYEAALLKKKVVTFSNNFYNRLENVTKCSDLENLGELLSKQKIGRNEDIINFLISLRQRVVEGEPSRAYGYSPQNLTNQDLLTFNKIIKLI